MGSSAPQARSSSHSVGGDSRPDATLRLRRFREEHPDIEINWRNLWEAAMPEPDGGKRWVMRHELHDVLDEVERRLARRALREGGGEAGCDRA